MSNLGLIGTNAAPAELPGIRPWRDDAISLPPELLWPSDLAPITSVGFRDYGSYRRGYIDGYSPWSSSEYQACRNGMQLYVNFFTGNDTTGTGTIGAPFKTPNKAQTVLNTANVPGTIWVNAGGHQGQLYYARTGQGTYTQTPTTPTCLMAHNGLVVIGCVDTYTWAANATYSWVYQTARTNCTSVYDPSRFDRFGNALPYTQVNSLLLCSITPDSWYTDGANIYVHRLGGVALTDLNVRVFLTGDNFAFSFGTNPQHFFIDRETPADGWDIQGCRFRIIASGYGASRKILAARGVSSRYGNQPGGDQRNAFGFDWWKGLIWLEECYGARATRDLFNFHNNGAGADMWAVLLNCKGRSAGQNADGGSNNDLTAHSDVCGIDVSGDYEDSGGGNCANVATTRWLLHGTRLAGDRGDYWMSSGMNRQAEVRVTENAKIWLSSVRIEPSSPENFAIEIRDNAEVYIRNGQDIVGRISGVPQNFV